jgi:L-tyrosine isonitrile desaturase/decarboxylase
MRAEPAPLRPFGLLWCASAGETLEDLPVAALRDLVRRHHLLVLRGFRAPASAEGFADYCARWGAISVWPFGRVLEVVEHAQPEDHIFDNSYVPMHWDGMYRPQVPEFQIFHCVNAPASGEGGRTTFSNTVRALEHASPEARDLWSRATVTYHRKMAYYDSKTASPIIAAHPRREFPVLRYNEPPKADDASFLNHPKLEFAGVSEDELPELHRTLRDALYGPESFYAHSWEVGDVVVADNYTLLHGREAFVHRAPRHLRRVHVLGDPPLDNPSLLSHQ